MAANDSAHPGSGTATYRFGPRETRGVLFGLGGGQLALVLVGLAACAAGISSGLVGLAIALPVGTGLLVAAVMPIGGRTSDEWAPVAISFLLGRVRGSHHRRYRPVSAV